MLGWVLGLEGEFRLSRETSMPMSTLRVLDALVACPQEEKIKRMCSRGGCCFLSRRRSGWMQQLALRNEHGRVGKSVDRPIRTLSLNV